MQVLALILYLKNIYLNYSENLMLQMARGPDWRFAGSDGLAKQLAILREGDKAIVADPLASLAPSAPTKIKMPTLDKASINNVVGGFDKLRHANPQNIKDLVSFSQSVNSELSKLKDEKSPQPQTTEGEWGKFQFLYQ